MQSDIAHTSVKDQRLFEKIVLKMKLFDLFQIIYQGNLVLIQWLQARGLVKDTLRCTARGCRAVMQLKPRSDIQDKINMADAGKEVSDFWL